LREALLTAVTRGVIYIRVSSAEQVDNLSLETQEARCRDYCQRNGIEVVQVFKEPGVSAKTTDRPAFKEMVGYCLNKRKNRIDAVVVYDITRFSRSTGDFYQVRGQFRQFGIVLRSATQQIDETPEGNFMATMIAAQGQYDNEKKGQRSIEGMKAALAKGRWTHQPPTGYLKTPPKTAPSLIRDPKRAGAVRMAFEMAALGMHSRQEIRDRIDATGFLTPRGKRLSVQTLAKILENPIYCGWMEVRRWSVRQKGDFDPIISEEIYNRVNPRKSVGTKIPRAHQKDNADFPLRRFITCTRCGKKISGSWSTSRRAKKYPYYSCPRCKGTGIRKEELERRFQGLLSLYKPKPGAVRLFLEVVRDLYGELRADSAKTAAALSERVAALKNRQNVLVDALIEGKISQDVYQGQEARRVREVEEAERELAQCAGSPEDVEKIIRFADKFFSGLDQTWPGLDLRQKQVFQSAIFPAGLTFDGKELRTPEIPLIFNVIAHAKRGKSSMASPGGFEPPLPP
jgi:site-specific DNA recombinase